MSNFKNQHNSPEAAVRHVRVEPSEDVEISSDEGHSWAVSYSDLLMVLMSFFIIFFQYDTDSSEKKKEVIESIAVSLQGARQSSEKGKEKNLSNSGISTEQKVNGLSSAPASVNKEQSAVAKDYQAEKSPVGVIGQLAPSLKANLSKLKVAANLETERNSLVVNLPNDIYRSGQYEINSETSRYLNQILQSLNPYRDDVDIYFIGHTDKSNISRKRGIIDNNFTLSSMRAQRALEYSLKQGFHESRVFVLGVGMNLRGSRTLSIKIQNKSQ